MITLIVCIMFLIVGWYLGYKEGYTDGKKYAEWIFKGERND